MQKKRSYNRKSSPRRRSEKKKSSPRRKTSPRRRSNKKKSSPRTKVQTIIFDKNIWTKIQSSNWLKKHNYEWLYLWYTDNYWHYELYEAKRGKKYRTINFSKDGDIKAVIEIL
jgi:hypothetical protein